MEGWCSKFPSNALVDRTGLTGKFDFVMEFSLDLNMESSFDLIYIPLPSDTSPADATGPTFLEALKEQLGLKLAPQKGPVDVLVIDHVEEPSQN